MKKYIRAFGLFFLYASLYSGTNYHDIEHRYQKDIDRINNYMDQQDIAQEKLKLTVALRKQRKQLQRNYQSPRLHKRQHNSNE
jgi:hypothetical protein